MRQSLLACLLLTSCTAPAPPAAEVKVTAPTAQSAGQGRVLRLDPDFDALLPADAKIEKIATGFGFTEGPLWTAEGNLWFSDVPGNVIHQWTPEGSKMEEVVRPSGYDGNLSEEIVASGCVQFDPESSPVRQVRRAAGNQRTVACA